MAAPKYISIEKLKSMMDFYSTHTARETAEKFGYDYSPAFASWIVRECNKHSVKKAHSEEVKLKFFSFDSLDPPPGESVLIFAIDSRGNTDVFESIWFDPNDEASFLFLDYNSLIAWAYSSDISKELVNKFKKQH